ncbi:MAG: DNA-processing protein DprA [Acidimicrobiales bacterium]
MTRGGEPTRDQLAAATVLAGLPAMTPQMLRRLVMGRPLIQTWERIARGLPVPGFINRADRMRLWATRARSLDPGDVLDRHDQAGVRVRLIEYQGYPDVLACDPQAPAVLFCLGEESALNARRIAIVGTRSCTRYGAGVAADFGAGLARAGVKVISGLALGIDVAAHQGALSVAADSAVAVVAGGLDVVYPRSTAALWSRVAEGGLIVSEAPLGVAHQAWRFPWRNRVIAALAEVLLVVESHSGGGSLHTVESANRRGLPVLGVPGPIRSPASVGVNRLLRDGAAPALDVTDVLVALERSRIGRPAMERPTPGANVMQGRTRCKAANGSVPVDGAGANGDGATAPRVEAPASGAGAPVGHLGPTEEAVLEQLCWEPISLDHVMARTGMSLGRVAFALELLEDKGLAVSEGTWWELSSGAKGPLPG